MSVKIVSFRNSFSIAGDPGFTVSHLHRGRRTYSRIQYGSMLDVLREKIEELGCTRGGEGYRYIGNEYRSPYSSDMRGGGFFYVTERLNGDQKWLTRFQFALWKIGAPFNTRAIQDACYAYGIEYILNKYFDCVDRPLENDLIIYFNDDRASHAGVYRNNGTVESRWDRGNDAFQHDFFFLPFSFGTIGKFYRAKESFEDLNLPLPHQGPPMYEQREEGSFHYVRNENNDQIRKEIDENSRPELTAVVPQIQWMKYIKFAGVCFDYAFGKFFETYMPPIILQMYSAREMLNTYFVPIAKPEIGDLVVYYNEYMFAQHFGIYIAPDLIESKWGAGAVYRHPPFHVDSDCGDTLIYYRLKPDFTRESVLNILRKKELDS